MDIRVKRVYEEPDEADGYRILVDRLWPRGLTKGEVAVDLWLKSVAPSTGLRQLFGHDLEKWGEFECGYFAELDKKRDLVMQILDHAKKGRVTLLYGAREDKHNNAVALKEYIITKRKELTEKAA